MNNNYNEINEIYKKHGIDEYSNLLKLPSDSIDQIINLCSSIFDYFEKSMWLVDIIHSVWL